MKRLLFVLILVSAVCGAEVKENAAAKLPPLTEWKIISFQLALHRTRYPVPFGELFDKLGGKETMAESWGHSHGEPGKKMRDFEYYTIGRSPSSAGAYQIEFEFGDLRDDERNRPVIGARLCFLAPLGPVFYADDIGPSVNDQDPRKNEANQPPLQTPTSGTPAAGAPVAPPSGAAGR